LPYPDVVPPWLELSDLSVMSFVADNGSAFRYTFDTLQPGHFYYVSVANHGAEGLGGLCEPLLIRPGGRIPGPIPKDSYLFVQDGDLAPIRWEAPETVDVDHFNIYRFNMDDTLPGLYYPFYDNGEFGVTAAPADSFYREGQWYYYYAMEPYAQVDSGITGFSDYPYDSTFYYITAVDKQGHESDFSGPVSVFIVDSYTPGDILVINCRRGTMQVDRADCDSIDYFYNYVLGGMYDRYDMPETVLVYGGMPKPDMWRDLIPYRLVIVDGGLEGEVISDNVFFPTEGDFEKYILSGGKLACFGSFTGLRQSPSNEPPQFYAVDNHPFIFKYFGIDSLFHIGLTYYPYPSTTADTSAALIGAIPNEAGCPYLSYAPLVNGLGAIALLWPDETAPAPSAFKLNDHGLPLYAAETKYPLTSRIDNEAIGVKTEVAGTATYLFGFHLWYMDADSAYSLINYILNDGVSVSFVCGDANGDEAVDISDAVFLVNYVFRNGPDPSDALASDPNGDGVINVGDIVYLVNFMFRDGEPPNCP
jgi:hypothetical protein